VAGRAPFFGRSPRAQNRQAVGVGLAASDGERTFGWLNRWRRLSKDYEQLPPTSETMIYATMSLVMTRRLARF
jgi:transposase